MIYTFEGTSQKIAELILSFTTNKYLVLFLINVFLLSWVSPGAHSRHDPHDTIFLPVVKQLGVDPVHFGLIICYNLTIGIITPPMGSALRHDRVVNIKFEDLVRRAYLF